jgi:hypothetical protein
VARVGPCCTFEEENWGGQQLSKILRRWTRTCLNEKVSIRRRPMPMVWLDQRRPLPGIMLWSCRELVAKKYFGDQTNAERHSFVLA